MPAFVITAFSGETIVHEQGVRVRDFEDATEVFSQFLADCGYDLLDRVGMLMDWLSQREKPVCECGNVECGNVLLPYTNLAGGMTVFTYAASVA